MLGKKLFRNIFPYTIKNYRSPINGLIQVIMAFNRPRLIIGGMIQSGGQVKKIWEKAVEQLREAQVKINQALIIGLGCGDCAFELKKHYPQIKMTGVEIDEQIINAAQCYFNLATVKNLKIAIQDGVQYVNRLARQKRLSKFDLIIVDAYVGDKIPQGFKTKKFLTNLTKILTHNGIVIYNLLFDKKNKKETENFIQAMEKAFDKITLARVASNLLAFGWF